MEWGKMLKLQTLQDEDEDLEDLRWTFDAFPTSLLPLFFFFFFFLILTPTRAKVYIHLLHPAGRLVVVVVVIYAFCRWPRYENFSRCYKKKKPWLGIEGSSSIWIIENIILYKKATTVSNCTLMDN
jgi:hypothetical protein